MGTCPLRTNSPLYRFSRACCQRQTFLALPLFGGFDGRDALTLVLLALSYSRACRSDGLFVGHGQRLAPLGSTNLSPRDVGVVFVFL